MSNKDEGVIYQAVRRNTDGSVAATAQDGKQGHVRSTGVVVLPARENQLWHSGAEIYWNAKDGQASITAPHRSFQHWFLIGTAAERHKIGAKTCRVELKPADPAPKTAKPDQAGPPDKAAAASVKKK